jgi:hypothetical protein
MSDEQHVREAFLANLQQQLPLPEICWQDRVSFRHGAVESISLSAQDLISVEHRLFELVPLHAVEIGVDVPVEQIVALPSLSRVARLRLIFPTKANLEGGLRAVAASPHTLAGLTELECCQDLGFWDWDPRQGSPFPIDADLSRLESLADAPALPGLEQCRLRASLVYLDWNAPPNFARDRDRRAFIRGSRTLEVSYDIYCLFADRARGSTVVYAPPASSFELHRNRLRQQGREI